MSQPSIPTMSVIFLGRQSSTVASTKVLGIMVSDLIEEVGGYLRHEGEEARLH